MIAECYDLSVQCDSVRHILPVRESFNGPHRKYCWQLAKDAGWHLTRRSGIALCPQCSRLPTKPKSESREGQ